MLELFMTCGIDKGTFCKPNSIIQRERAGYELIDYLADA